MGGIYLHIPFCKQACHYCDFHFSTSLAKKEQMIAALKKEMILRKEEFKNEHVTTIYLGGGTPTVLETSEINDLIDAVYLNYKVIENPEITLEANPDDLTKGKVEELAKSPINRLSIGVQSFFEGDLKFMNRAHNVKEAEECIKEAIKYFENISIDLIYGIPGMTNKRWQQNIDKALSLGIPHISSYALTVEPKTALANFIKKGKVKPIDDEQAQKQFHLLYDVLTNKGFDCYEVSNFGKPGYYSIKAIAQDALHMTTETLSKTDKYNEYVMTGLRTSWGISLARIQTEFGDTYTRYLNQQIDKYIKQGLLVSSKEQLVATKKGKFLIDGIASDLFMINLD